MHSCRWNCWGALVPHKNSSYQLLAINWCHKNSYLRCWGGRKACLCHYSYYYCYFSNWISFKIYLIWAHLKFHYKLHFCSASVTIHKSKFSSLTFSSYPVPLWRCMMRKKTYMLFLVCQSFLPQKDSGTVVFLWTFC